MTGTTSSTLPDQALAWVAARAPAVITSVTPISGGMTQTKWLLQLAEGDPLVIRWSAPRVWGAVGREHVRREALACRMRAGADLPVPELVASDIDGAAAGGPANLMTWLPGRTRLDPLGPRAIADLARLAVSVHRQVVPVRARPPTFSFRGPGALEVPDWAWRPDLWRKAIEVRAVGPPPTPYGLIHRDFHLSNIVWRADTVSGLVDWADTSWGPPDLDVAHLCSDFAMLHTPANANTFRAEYLRQGGRLDPDPDRARFWAVSDILGFLPDPAHILDGLASSRPDLTADVVRQGLENLLASLLA